MKKATTAADKALQTITTMQAAGVQKMADITRLLGVVYAPENISFAGIQTKQLLQSAGATNAAMLLDEALWAVFDGGEGFRLAATIQAAGLAWLRKQASRKDSALSWRENEALKDGAAIRWAGAQAEYNPRTGESLHYLPVFDVVNAENGESFQYYMKNGTAEICG